MSLQAYCSGGLFVLALIKLVLFTFVFATCNADSARISAHNGKKCPESQPQLTAQTCKAESMI